jgi:hypothetical protein
MNISSTLIKPKFACCRLQAAASTANEMKFREDMVGPAGPGPGQSNGHHVMEIAMAMNDMDGGTCNMSSQFAARPALTSRSLTLSGDSGEHQDCNASPLFFSSGEPSLSPKSPDSVSIAQARDSAMLRYKEKRKIRRFIPTFFLNKFIFLARRQDIWCYGNILL